MNKVIITDIDECVLQWQKGFIEFINHIKNENFNPDMDIHENIELHMNLDYDEIEELLYEFNTSNKFGELNVGYKSEIYIPKLHEEGYQFYAITSCGSDTVTKENRVKNIIDIFGDIFLDIHCIDYTISKDEYLKILPRDSIWVEDKTSNSELGLKYNHMCFLIHHDYNINHNNDNIIRVSDWEEIYNKINSLNNNMEN